MTGRDDAGEGNETASLHNEWTAATSFLVEDSGLQTDTEGQTDGWGPVGYD